MQKPQKYCKFRGKTIDRIILKKRHAVVVDVFGDTYEHYFDIDNWKLERQLYKQEFEQYIVEDIDPHHNHLTP